MSHPSCRVFFWNVLCAFMLVSTTLCASSDPIGQFADYLIDHNPKRTSDMIRSGKVKVTVLALHEEMGASPSYEISMDYDFNILMVGAYQGTERILLEKRFFSGEFLQELRQAKHYETEYFKADHLGFATVKNMDGKIYPNCDKVLLYDLKQPPSLWNGLFETLFETALYRWPGLSFSGEHTERKIENLKALVHLHDSVPAVHGAKIDVSGVYSGMNLKAGGDYESL